MKPTISARKELLLLIAACLVSTGGVYALYALHFAPLDFAAVMTGVPLLIALVTLFRMRIRKPIRTMPPASSGSGAAV